MPKIHPYLWFDTNAEDAMNFYTSVFKNSKIGKVRRFTDSVPGSDGKVPLAEFEFELEGLPITALNAGPQHTFNESVSLYLETEDQAETDYYWNALMAGGGFEQPCGWLKDKYGLSWQVIPKALPRLLGDQDRRKSDRVLQAMYKMEKIIIADLERAYAGSSGRSAAS